MSAQSIDSHANAAPLGSISSFTLHHRAGYAAYVRAIYCVPSLVEIGAQEVVETERIGDAINLGRDEVRSLKGLDIPTGAQVQFVLEVVAAGSPRVIAPEVWRFLPSSFRTATYKCSQTVFNPKLELDLSRPRLIVQEEPQRQSMSPTELYDEKTALLDDRRPARSLLCCCL